ncbi:MAG: cyclic nucleotide-binding domain-containing protein [Bdellovibrionales bacterium]|nr:cyclic nucleotide-binding domain-containing protein [Bdellovibrionales bacterium]
MSRGAKKLDSVQDATAPSSILRDLHFFKHFPDHLLDKLGREVQIKTVSTGSVILTQGQINTDLFILLSGRLSVSVDGGVVARLDKKGDLVGEMSVITHQAVAATITAEMESQILILRGKDFLALEGTSSDGFQHALFRVYAHDLSNKLRVTNQKAKYFEDLTTKLTQAQDDLREVNKGLELKVASRTLDLNKRTQDLQKSHQKLEQQNAELMASHKKMEELYFTRELTFQKLEELYKNSLIPLQMTLIQIEQNSVGGVNRISLKRPPMS